MTIQAIEPTVPTTPPSASGILDSIITASSVLRIGLRRHAGCDVGDGRPVVVVAGDVAPTKIGVRCHYETRGGTWIRHPGTYQARGWSNMRYCASTIRVEVGAGWLARELSRGGSHRRLCDQWTAQRDAERCDLRTAE